MREGAAQGVFPGAVLLVAREDRIVFHRAYGWADLFCCRKMTPDTAFDLASLTKPLATTLAVMRLVQNGGIDLNRPVASYCPALEDSDKARITTRQLLSHRSGLIAWRPYYMHLRRLPAKARTPQMRRWLHDEPLQTSPDQRSDYSDAGFLLLQWILEAIARQPLIAFVTESIYAPLGLEDLYFPALKLPSDRRPVAATELCPWRNRLLVEEVHDDNAAVLGGAAAHAGLFGTAKGVYLLLASLLRAEAQLPGAAMFDPQVVKMFFQPREGADWALGFDTPSKHGSSAGRFFSRDSVGHLGFTGTSFWMDRRRRIMVVLLTNRVHPSRYNTRIRDFRPRLHDAVMSALQ